MDNYVFVSMMTSIAGRYVVFNPAQKQCPYLATVRFTELFFSTIINLEEGFDLAADSDDVMLHRMALNE